MKKKYDNGVYEGEGTLLTKKRNGHGVMKYTNGEIYEGQWKDDKRHGKGELYRPKAYLSKAYSYTGTWVDDHLNLGTYVEGDTTYNGEFKDGKYNGHGTITKKLYNSSVYYSYEGSFVAGNKHGQGTETCSEYTYTGAFAQNMLHGKGKKVFSNKDYCDGIFVNGRFSKGKMRKTEATGDVYEGSYESYAYNGHGKLTMTDGTVYTGNFKAGQLHGIITITKPDGTKIKEKYENGVSLEENKAPDTVETAEQNKQNTAVESTAEQSAPKAIAEKALEQSKSQAITEQEKAQESALRAYSVKEKTEKRMAEMRKKIDALPMENSYFYEKLNAYGKYKGEKNPSGKPHGYGIYKFPLSGSYEGDFVNGAFSGLGTHETGPVKYYGEVVSLVTNGMPGLKNKGYGVFTKNNGEEYAGEFDITFHGYGVLKYENGDKFEGKFYYGKRTGAGVLTYASGDRYEGEFSSDAITGKGKLIKTDGTSYDGKFKNGKLDGTITVTMPNGETKKEKYKNGELLEASAAKSTSSKSSNKKAATVKKQNTNDKTAVDKDANKKETIKKETTKKKTAEKSNSAKKKSIAEEKKSFVFPSAEYKAISEACQSAAKISREAEKKAEEFARDSVSLMKKNEFSCSLKDAIKFTNLKGHGDDTYKGDAPINGKLQGYGEYLWADGQKFYGEWKNDKRTGLGVYFYTPSNRYEGQHLESAFHGNGVYYFESGNVYKGEFTDSKFNGYGTYYWATGDRYEGQWKSDERTGKGVYYYNDGNIYEGNFLNGKRTGKGILYFSNGDRCAGDFFNDNIDGHGTYFWTNGDVYVGEWNNGQRTGKGILYLGDNEKYEGTFVNGDLHGFVRYKNDNGGYFEGKYENNKKVSGVSVYNNGDKYDGSYKDGKLHGKGVYIFANGNKDEGNFKNGKLNGKGSRTFANGDVFVGNWKDDKRTGKGVLTYANGDKYEGDWKDDYRTGTGVYTFANGDKYEGEFLDGFFNGKGVFTYAGGDKYEGEFLDDFFHGKGTYIFADGERSTGIYEKGIFISSADNTEGEQSEATTNNTNFEVKETEAKKNEDKGNEDKGNEKKEAKEKSFTPEKPKKSITFDDVAGLNDVKDQIKFNVLEPIKNPELAAAFGIKPGGKILLYGPPGTGKTFIARAIAGEIDAAFYPVNCQDLNSKWVGEGTEMLNNLFKEARKNDRAIIFFDEFDSMAYKRDTGNSSAGIEMARFVATLLTNVDGFKAEDENKMLLLIAATNRPWAIDPAMLRGGRFDTQIYVGVPDGEAREFLVNKALDKLPLESEVNLKDIALSLEGYGGGDIVAICEKIRLEAYKKSVKSGKMEKVSLTDCETARNSVKNNITPEELAKFEAYKNGQKLD